MDWASIAEVISAIAMIALAGATFWMGRQSKKSICQTKEIYEKENTPLLLFDFDFNADAKQFIARDSNEDEKSDGVCWTSINGTLKNVSNTAAVDCELSIIKTEKSKDECFERKIKLAVGIQPKENKKIVRRIYKKDYAGVKPYLTFLQIFDYPENKNELCKFVIVFYYKNKFGNKFETRYRVNAYINGNERKAEFIGSGIVKQLTI